MNIENHSLKKFRSAGLVIASFLSFFIFGFSDVLKGTAIPEIIAETSFGYNTGGALIGFTYFGFFAGTLSSVFLLKKWRAPVLMAVAVAAACSGLVLFSVEGRVLIMFVAAFLIGCGGGLIDVTANLTIRMISDRKRIGRRLNQLAFFHGGGAIVSPFFAGLILSLTAQWRFIYLYAGVLTSLLVIVIVVLVRRTGIKEFQPEDDSGTLRFNPAVVLLGGVLFFYMTLEAGISGWIVEYGRNTIGLNENTALFYLSLFFILLTAGRFFSSFYVDRIGLHRSVFLNFTLILILVGAGVLFEKFFFLIAISGFFMAPIFPTTVALISSELESSNIRIMGIFFSVAGLGGIFGPWMIGMIADSFSLQAGFALLMVFSICAITISALFRCVSGQRIK